MRASELKTLPSLPPIDEGESSRADGAPPAASPEGEVPSSPLAAPAASPSRIVPTRARSARSSLPERDFFLPGWEKIASHTFTRTVETGLRDTDPCRRFNPASFERGGLGRSGSPDLNQGEAERTASLDRLCFFDLETTGLSGGSGTIAFLAAMGFFEGGSFLVTQVFIDDFPGETFFLDFTLNLLAERPFLVTYNGAAFDLPLLRTRCILNAFPVPEFGHIDLLRITRRLWRRTLGSCSLQALESAVLGEEREGDVPGFLIPRLWLDYAAGGPSGRGKSACRGESSCGGEPSAKGEPGEESAAAMEKIVEHNARDVISLARLFLRIDGIMAEPLGRFFPERVYVPNLALDLIAVGRVDEGRRILEEAGAGGDIASLLFLARLHRREGRIEEYGRIVAAVDERTVEACVEKAKYREHARKDPRGALACAERALAILEAQRMDEEEAGKGAGFARKWARRRKTEAGLKARRDRLMRKIGESDREGRKG